MSVTETIPEMIARLTAERANWEECAAQMSRNADYYRGLLEQIAPTFGAAAYTADDGSVYDSPLCLKIPELVTGLAADRDRLAALVGLAEAVCEAMSGLARYEIGGRESANIMAKLQAWQDGRAALAASKGTT
jgi:hypothetical protein